MSAKKMKRPSKGSSRKGASQTKNSSQVNALTYGLIAVIGVLIIAGVYYFAGNSGGTGTGVGDGEVKETPSDVPSDADSIARGAETYGKLCVSCHGKNGEGERPEDMYAVDANGFVVAPPLDSSAHAWHHSDTALVDFILNGSPQNPRMRAWKDTLDRQSALELVAYMKSLWSPEVLACQGDAHMTPECQGLSNAP